MGGDYAPAEIVRGALDYLYGTEELHQVLLVGVPERIHAELAAENARESERLRIVPALQIIEMDEHPMEAFREKRDSSIVVCNQLVRKGEADAAFSAGNTGAMMVASTLVLELLEGVRRAGIAAMLPRENGGYTVVVDAGANVDCRAKHLEHFALLGSVFNEKVMGIENPRVGLLANGEEPSKGNEMTREAFVLLSALHPRINFIGNVEGNHVTENRVDVVVCDGLVGNVLLKGAEGVGRLAISILKQNMETTTDPETLSRMDAVMAQFRHQFDYSEHGGAPLLGVNGVSIIAHGRSDRRAIANGIRQAARAVQSGYLEAVRIALKETRLKQGQQE
jgi:phosphate acyltransferase